MTYLIHTGENYIRLLPFYILIQIAIMLVCKAEGRTIPPGFVWGAQVLALLMTFLLVITGESGIFDIIHYEGKTVAGSDQINLLPFQLAYRDRFGFIMNLVAFVPFGLLLPLLWQSFSKFYKTAAAGLCLSLVIELTQLFNIRATDIDDLFMNTAGTILGYLLYFIFFRKRIRYFQLKNASNCGAFVEKSGNIFVVSIFICSYFIRPLIDLWI